MAITGSCHCGKITYSLDEEMPTEGMSCNCSICRRKGYVHHFTAPDVFVLTADDGDIAAYEFNHHIIHHKFCRTCGCAPFADGTAPDGKAMIALNLRCVDGIDVEALKITHFDGASR